MGCLFFTGTAYVWSCAVVDACKRGVASNFVRVSIMTTTLEDTQAALRAEYARMEALRAEIATLHAMAMEEGVPASVTSPASQALPSPARLPLPWPDGRSVDSETFPSGFTTLLPRGATRSDDSQVLSEGQLDTYKDGADRMAAADRSAAAGETPVPEASMGSGICSSLMGEPLWFAVRTVASSCPPGADAWARLLGLLNGRMRSAIASIGSFVDGTVAYTLSKTWHDLLSTFVFGLHPMPFCGGAEGDLLPCTPPAPSSMLFAYAAGAAATRR